MDSFDWFSRELEFSQETRLPEEEFSTLVERGLRYCERSRLLGKDVSGFDFIQIGLLGSHLPGSAAATMIDAPALAFALAAAVDAAVAAADAVLEEI